MAEAPVIQPSGGAGGASLAPDAGNAGAGTTINPTEARVQQQAAAAMAAQQASVAYRQRERDVRDYTDALVEYHELPDEFRSTEAPDRTMIERRGTEIASRRAQRGVDLAANARAGEAARFAGWEEDQRFEGDRLNRARNYLYYQREKASASTTSYFNRGMGTIEADVLDVQKAYNEARLNNRDFTWNGPKYSAEQLAQLEASGMPDWQSSEWMRQSRLANPTSGRAGILLDPMSQESQAKLDAEFQNYLKFLNTPLTFENKVYMPRVSPQRIAADAAQNAARVEYNEAQNASLAGRMAMAESMGVSLQELGKIDAAYRARAAAEPLFSPQTIDLSSMDVQQKHEVMTSLGLRTFDQLDQYVDRANADIVRAHGAGYSSPAEMRAAEKAEWTAYQNRGAAEQTNPVLREYAEAAEGGIYDELGVPQGFIIPVSEQSLNLTTGALRENISAELAQQNLPQTKSQQMAPAPVQLGAPLSSSANTLYNVVNPILKGIVGDAVSTSETYFFTPNGDFKPVSLNQLGKNYGVPRDSWQDRIDQYNAYDGSGESRHMAQIYTTINIASLPLGGMFAKGAVSKVTPWVTGGKTAVSNAQKAAATARAAAPLGTNPTIEAFTAGTKSILKSTAKPVRLLPPFVAVGATAPSGIDDAVELPLIKQSSEVGGAIRNIGKSIGYDHGVAGIAGSYLGSRVGSLFEIPAAITGAIIGTAKIAKNPSDAPATLTSNLATSVSSLIGEIATDPIAAAGDITGFTKGMKLFNEGIYGAKDLSNLATGRRRGDIQVVPLLHSTGQGYTSAIYSGAINPQFAKTAARLETAPAFWIKDTGFESGKNGATREFGISYSQGKPGNIGKMFKFGNQAILGKSSGIVKDPATEELFIDLSRKPGQYGLLSRPGEFAINAIGESATLLGWLDEGTQQFRTAISSTLNSILPGAGMLVPGTRTVTVKNFQTRPYQVGNYRDVYMQEATGQGAKTVGGDPIWDLQNIHGNPSLPYAVPTPKQYAGTRNAKATAGEKEIFLASDDGVQLSINGKEQGSYLPVEYLQWIGQTKTGEKIYRVYNKGQKPQTYFNRRLENIRRNTNLLLNPAVFGRGTNPLTFKTLTQAEAVEAAFRFAELASSSRARDITNHGADHIQRVNANMQYLRQIDPAYKDITPEIAELTAYFHDMAKNTSQEAYTRGHGEVAGDIIRSGASLDPRDYLRSEAIPDFETTLGKQGIANLNRLLSNFNTLSQKEKKRIANAVSQHSTNLGSRSGWVKEGDISLRNILDRILPPNELSRLLSDSDRIDLIRFFPNDPDWRPIEKLMFADPIIVEKVIKNNYLQPATRGKIRGRGTRVSPPAGVRNIGKRTSAGKPRKEQRKSSYEEYVPLSNTSPFIGSAAAYIGTLAEYKPPAAGYSGTYQDTRYGYPGG
ncbi:MAG: hypothetical protein O0X96_05755, partial [Methanocorpusculum sp.]|nr:hypothetical protein [Methanocorpusculum sp.]